MVSLETAETTDVKKLEAEKALLSEAKKVAAKEADIKQLQSEEAALAGVVDADNLATAKKYFKN